MEMEVENNIEPTKNIGNRTLKLSRKRSWKILAVALYITFLILSSIPFLADTLLEPDMKEVYEYHLVYPNDGRQGHYYIERVDDTKLGIIDLVYTPDSNSLSINSRNIKVLNVYCRSMYKDECEKVFGFDPSDNYNYYKWYFIEKNHLTVNVETDSKIDELSFIDTPVPYQVYVNGLLWYEGREYNYTDDHKTVLSNVPKGNIHVDIYFKSSKTNTPTAIIKADRSIVNINTLVKFDGTASFDPDGEIEFYIWDFGDGNNSGGVINYHTYSEPGTYTIILTVRDNDKLVDHAYHNITVLKGSTKPIIKGVIPNQVKVEDSPPWELNLRSYGMDFDGAVDDLKWYLTGEKNNLYNLVGENGSEQKFIFSLIPNAYGNDQVKIFVVDNDGYYASQKMWINITSVNDKPTIRKLPQLSVHYGVPYRFSIVDYINDVETPYYKLKISVSDNYATDYVIILGEELILEYPKEYMGKEIIITITVSDAEDTVSALLITQVTDNWPPILKDSLPDITLEENQGLYKVFNLSDYFSDPDGEELYYTYSESNVNIIIHDDSSVDFIAKTKWIGIEKVIFRAQDNRGALVEDTIKITVVPINDPPKIGDIPDLKVHYDHVYSFDISYYISDSDNELYELILTTSDPNHISIDPDNNLGILIKYPKNMLGITTKVVLTVSDEIFDVSKSIFITVMNQYPPELIKKLPDASFNEDEKLIEYFDLDDHFLDLDNDTLYYTTGNKMVQIIIDSDHRVTFDSKPNWFGNEKIIFRATDPSGAIVEDSIIVTVFPINDPPTFRSLPKLIINESETVEFELKYYIYDIDDNTSNLTITVDDQNVFVSGTSLIILGSETLPKDIDVMVSDSIYTVTRTLEIKVISKKSQNDDSLEEVITLFVGIIIIIVVLIIVIFMFYQRKMQQFDVKEIFLIHNSGKLLNHIYFKTHSKFDDEIFSGMFTAIQEFIEDTFSTGEQNNDDKNKNDDTNIGKESASLKKLKALKINTRNEKIRIKPLKLNEFKVGDNQVIIEHGQYLFMAVVYGGPGSRKLHKVVQNAIEEIEEIFSDRLEYWDGDIKQVAGIKKYLQKLLPEEKVKSQKFTPISNRKRSLKKHSKTDLKVKANRTKKRKNDINRSEIITKGKTYNRSKPQKTKTIGRSIPLKQLQSKLI